MPSQILYQQRLLKISIGADGTDNDVGARWMLTRKHIRNGKSRVDCGRNGRSAKRLCRDAVRIDSRLDAIEEPANQG